MLTNGQTQKGERQKASIDRWNQDVVDSSNPSQQTAGCSHDHRPPLPPHALGSAEQNWNQVMDHQHLIQDHSGSFKPDHYSGSHSAASQRPHNGYSPAKRYDPYDLSPAYLGNYSKEHKLPGDHHDSYSVPPVGHMHAHHDSFGHQQGPYSSYVPSIHKGHKEYLPQQQYYYDQSQDQAHAHQQQQLRPQDSHKYDLNGEQGYLSQHKTPSGRDESSHREGNWPPQPEMSHARSNTPQGSSQRDKHQAQPLGPASGWDDDSPAVPADVSQAPGDHMAAGTQPFDFDQFKEAVQGDVRPRGDKQRRRGRGTGRGRSQQQSYRPDKQSNLSSQHQVSLQAVLR